MTRPRGIRIECDDSVPRAIAEHVQRLEVASARRSESVGPEITIHIGSHSPRGGISIFTALEASILDARRNGPTLIVEDDSRSLMLLLELASLIANRDRAGEFVRAQALTRRWELASYPCALTYLLACADVLIQIGNLADGISFVTEAGQLFPVDMRGAGGVFRPVLRPDADSPTAHWLLEMAWAGVAGTLALPELSAQLRDVACESAPNDPPRLRAAKVWSRAITAAHRGRADLAVAVLGGPSDLPHEFAALSDAERARAMLDKAQLALDLGDLSHAIQLYDSASMRELDGDGARAVKRLQLRLLLAAKRHEEVVSLARVLRAERSSSADQADLELVGLAWHSEGLAHYRAGRWQEAVDALSQALKIARDQGDPSGIVAADLLMARCYAALQLPGQANRALGEARTMAPRYAPEYLSDLALVESDLRR